MLFTKSTAYTLQALIVLSDFDKPVDVTKLSEITDIPKPFLAKLLQILSKKGFVKSFKGIHGGFLLEKKSNEIKILDIFKIIEDKDSLVFYCSKNPQNCVRNRFSICNTMPFFRFLEKEIYEILENLTLEDVIRMKSDKQS
jgi:Rrf2 family protein